MDCGGTLHPIGNGPCENHTDRGWHDKHCIEWKAVKTTVQHGYFGDAFETYGNASLRQGCMYRYKY